ncbi:MAG: hypothetical protein CMF69_09160 [Magnetovibrio sp.]|nr:hypothetical protein [Magnetovibrio sp.]
MVDWAMRLRYRLTILPIILMVLISALSSNVLAKRELGASNWVETEYSRVRLVAASATISSQKISLGLHFELKPGWKIYWRSPGDAGFSPIIDWADSSNLKSATLTWPVPQRFSILGLETLGYQDDVLLPINAQIVHPQTATNLVAKVSYLTCNKICIPYEARLTLHLPAGLPQTSPHAHLINIFTSQVPQRGDWNGLKIISLKTWKHNGQTWLRLLANSDKTFKKPDAFVEGPTKLTYSKPTIRISDGGNLAHLYFTVSGLNNVNENLEKSLAGTLFTVTMVNGNTATEITMPAKEIAPTAIIPPSSPSRIGVGPSIAFILLLALIGGFILNFMPCVLPVLSLKIFSLIDQSGSNPREVRLGFLASAAGIISAFIVLALSLIVLRSIGSTIGWGIQFQQPWFLATLVLIITIFACNLWGFFEFHLPKSLSGIGQNFLKVDGLVGHFLQGTLTTILATPCTAPFLGTAVSFALVGSTIDILIVFFVLGTGLALPHIIISAFPLLAAQFPKPGNWMLYLKHILGFLLAGTAVWLFYILIGVSGLVTASVIGFASLSSILLMFLAHRKNFGGVQLSAPGLCLLATVTLTTPLWTPNTSDVDRRFDLGAGLIGIWKPFEPTIINELVSSGKTVFVDITADWCITCQVNKNLVIKSTDVIERMSRNNVIAMQADWTRPDHTISQYLSKFNRFGIPFNVVYGPNAPNGIILPELLTKSAIFIAFANAETR